MNDFQGMEDLLQDFLTEAGDLLAGVDNELIELEGRPEDKSLLNEIFRGFHTIKGGAGFLNAQALVTLCHLTESLFDRLRNGELALSRPVMDVIMDATAMVRKMFFSLERGSQPEEAPAGLLELLRQALAGELDGVAASPGGEAPAPEGDGPFAGDEPDWDGLLAAVASFPVPPQLRPPEPGAQPAAPGPAPVAKKSPPAPSRQAAKPGPRAAAKKSPAPPAAAPAAAGETSPEEIIQRAIGRRASDKPGYQGGSGRRDGEKARENSIRVDTARLDQVLNLSGEIGLAKNRLNSLRTDLLNGRHDSETLQAMDQAVSQLDLLVSDLQSAVMKTRMQPVGRLFQKYPRIARDLARSLGKDVELVLFGEETEIDKTMIEDLSDPLIHLIRNAIDHGIETPEERRAAGKPARSQLRLEARQEGDHILLLVADDGRGMNAEELRARALARGLISDEDANTMDERQSLNLVMLPGFSTREEVSDLSGRGVGMDVVKTNIQKLNGSIDIRSAPGKGATFIISLPLTLAVLPVLIVYLGEQPFAVPLSMVREILPVAPQAVQEIGGRAAMVVRGEVLPMLPLAHLLGWRQERVPQYGVLMQTADASFILTVDRFAGREDAVIKSLEDFRPRGVAGVTTMGNGQIVLILDVNELLTQAGGNSGVPRSALSALSASLPASLPASPAASLPALSSASSVLSLAA